MRMVGIFGKTYLWLYDEDMRLYLNKVKDATGPSNTWLSIVEYEEFEPKWPFLSHWTTCLGACPELSSESDRVILGFLVPVWRPDNV